MYPVDVTADAPVEALSDLTDGVGADVIFEAVGGDQSHGTDGSDSLAVAFEMARHGGTVVQIGHIVGDISLTPRTLRLRNVDWVNPARGVRQLGPNTDTGELARSLVAAGRVDLDRYVTHERRDGLAGFEDAVASGLGETNEDALGPVQMVLIE